MKNFNEDKTAVLGNEGEFTSFSFRGQTIRFRASPHLEYYTKINEWDNGYIVVMAKYDNSPQEEEEYMDLCPILESLYMNPKEWETNEMERKKPELTWAGKNEPLLVEPRILIYDREKSYGDQIAENMLIHGDNLLALKALEAKYAGQVKCIYIDPPYNTGSAFEHYDDNFEHSAWLNLMYERVKFLYSLLCDGGSLWISIDDTESHRLRMIMDEIFGVNSFVADITYERSGSAGLGQGGLFVNNSEHILLYAKGYFVYNNILGTHILEQKTMKRYNKILKDEGEKELVETFSAKSNGLPIKIYCHKNFIIETISLKDFQRREKEIRFLYSQNFEKLFRTNNVQKENKFQNELMNKMDKKLLYTVEYIPSHGKYKNKKTTLYYYNAELFAWLRDTAFLDGNDIVKTNKLTTVWRHEDIPKADLANEGGIEFPRSKKPEQLMRRILSIATNPGDIVLDSFLGSGTTAAVAHKMGRRWIGIEMGEHAYTHCKVRLDRVIDGADTGGITKAADWKSGGGYRFYELAPSLIKTDSFGEPVISDEYDAERLAAAVALNEGFTYQPDPIVFWKQAVGAENSFLFTTTKFISKCYLDAIAGEMKPGEFLTIAATAFEDGLDRAHKNIRARRIPQTLLKKCVFGVENYNLPIIDPPTAIRA